MLKRTSSAVFAGGMHVFPGGMVDPEDVAEELSAAKNGWRFCNQRTEFPADVSSPSVLPQAWLLRHPILTHLRAVENGADPTWDP